MSDAIADANLLKDLLSYSVNIDNADTRTLRHISKVLLDVVGKEKLLSFEDLSEFTEASLEIINESSSIAFGDWEESDIDGYFSIIWDNLSKLKS